MITPSIYPDLTVVVPVYNRADEIRNVIDDIAAQSVRPGRIVIVDDGSTDSTRCVVEAARTRLAGILDIVVITGPHRGVCAARNAGLNVVTTEWTMFFDSDDRMDSRHIEVATSAITDAVDIVGWDTLRVSLDGHLRTLRFETDDIEWHNIMHGTLSTQRYMARTELFRRAGGWNEGISIWVDIELGARMLRSRRRAVAKAETDSPTVTIIAGDSSITGSSWSARANRYVVALDALRKALSPMNADWVDLKQAILAADISREKLDAGRDMVNAINKPSRAVRFAYSYRRHGGRGIARLLRHCFSKTATTGADPNILTVVIPVFNRRDTIPATLDSILCQTCLPGHVIIVDDGSSDGTADIVSQWIDIHDATARFTLIRAAHRGAAAARNTGLETVQSSWTMFFDSDDRMDSQHIATALSAVDDTADIVGWNVNNHRSNGSTQVFRFHKHDILWNNLMHGTFGTPRYMARTELFRRVGGWNESVSVWDDIELGTRIIAAEPRIRHAKGNRSTVDVIATAGSLTWAANETAMRYEPALRAMHADDLYPVSWLKLKVAILAADIARRHPDEGRQLYRTIPERSFAIRLAYLYRRMGGRGTARILRPFFVTPKHDCR